MLAKTIFAEWSTTLWVCKKFPIHHTHHPFTHTLTLHGKKVCQPVQLLECWASISRNWTLAFKEWSNYTKNEVSRTCLLSLILGVEAEINKPFHVTRSLINEPSTKTTMENYHTSHLGIAAGCPFLDVNDIYTLFVFAYLLELSWLWCRGSWRVWSDLTPGPHGVGSCHVRINVSVRRGILWGISMHSIHKGEVLFFSSVYIWKAVNFFWSEGTCTKGAPKVCRKIWQ